MEEKDSIVNIDIDQIYPHPNNPRKNIGDVSELANSIKKNGIMQNLTVIPGHRNFDGRWVTIGYTLLIGHRRHAAAKLAGISEVPCRIVRGMSQKEQLSTMLEENMQRNDLTIYEQAQGFQMMLDLGETEDTIAEKTGFSKTTIRHRLNIAKLDQSELKKKESDDGFQLTLKNLYELEKVKDVKLRNKILKESYSSRDLVSRAQSAASEEKRNDRAKAIAAMLKKLGVKKAPKEVEGERWSGKWKIVKEFDLDKDVPKQIKLPKEDGELLYAVWYRIMHVIVKAPKPERQLSEYELEQKERDKKKKKIKAILKESTAKRKDFIQNIISGKIDAVKDEEAVKDAIWKAMTALGSSVYDTTIIKFFLEKEMYDSSEEEKQEAREKVKKLSVLHQMMIILHASMALVEPFDYSLKFNSDRGQALQAGYQSLEPYGWYFESEEEMIINGTHELYASK